MSQLQHVVKLLPGPGAQVEGVAGVVGDDALQVRGAAADDEDRLHEGGDVTPPVSRHDGHPGPEVRLAADLLLIEDNDGVLVVVVPTQSPGYHGHVLTNFSTASIQERFTGGWVVWVCQFVLTLVQIHIWESLRPETDHRMWRAGRPPPRTTWEGSLLEERGETTVLGVKFTRSISRSQPGNDIFQYSPVCWWSCILPTSLPVPPGRPRNKILNSPLVLALGLTYSVLSNTVSGRANLGERQEQRQHSHQSHCWWYNWSNCS